MKELPKHEYSRLMHSLASTYRASSDFRALFDERCGVLSLRNDSPQHLRDSSESQAGMLPYKALKTNKIKGVGNITEPIKLDLYERNAQLSVIINSNRFLLPFYRDNISIFRRIGVLNGTKIDVARSDFKEDLRAHYRALDLYFAPKGKLIMVRDNQDGKIALIYSPKLETAGVSEGLVAAFESDWSDGFVDLKSEKKPQSTRAVHNLECRIEEGSKNPRTYAAGGSRQ